MSTQTERQRIWNQRYRKRNPERYVGSVVR